MQTQSTTIHALFVALAGPIIWFAHFATVNASHALLCAMSKQPGESISHNTVLIIPWVIGVATFAALAGILLVIRMVVRTPAQTASPAEGEHQVDFLGFVQLAFAGLSAVSILWVALAAALIPVCARISG